VSRPPLWTEIAIKQLISALGYTKACRENLTDLGDSFLRGEFNDSPQKVHHAASRIAYPVTKAEAIIEEVLAMIEEYRGK